MAEYGFTFDPFKLTGVSVPRERREEAMEAVAEYLKEEALVQIGKGKSPVHNGPWEKKLTKEYRDRKREESSVTTANLELSGDLLDALDVTKAAATKLFYGVEGDQAGKAEGNNIGSYGREPDEGKARRFIPEKGETFTPAIIRGMREILEEFVE